MQIWKFTLHSGSRTIAMPAGAKIISLQTQNDEPCIWAICDPSAPYESRLFSTYGTGHELPDDPGIFIGTFQLHGGVLVFHVFEKA